MIVVDKEDLRALGSGVCYAATLEQDLAARDERIAVLERAIDQASGQFAFSQEGQRILVAARTALNPKPEKKEPTP
jgi:hypothetical protein